MGRPGRCGAFAGVGEVAGAADVQEGGRFAGCGGSGDDQGGPCGGPLVAAEDHQGAGLGDELADAGVRMVTNAEWKARRSSVLRGGWPGRGGVTGSVVTKLSQPCE